MEEAWLPGSDCPASGKTSGAARIQKSMPDFVI